MRCVVAVVVVVVSSDFTLASAICPEGMNWVRSYDNDKVFNAVAFVPVSLPRSKRTVKLIRHLVICDDDDLRANMTNQSKQSSSCNKNQHSKFLLLMDESMKVISSDSIKYAGFFSFGTFCHHSDKLSREKSIDQNITTWQIEHA